MLRTTIIAALALTTAHAGAAQQPATTRSVRVSTADLDLSRQAGVAELDRRIKRAVEEVCPYRPNADVPTLMAHRACMRGANRSAAKARDAVIARSRSSAAEVATAAR